MAKKKVKSVQVDPDLDLYTEPFFDEEEFFDREVGTLMRALQNKCEERGLPMVCQVVFMNNKDQYGSCSCFGFPSGDRTPKFLRWIGYQLKEEEAALGSAVGMLISETEGE